MIECPHCPRWFKSTEEIAKHLAQLPKTKRSGPITNGWIGYHAAYLGVDDNGEPWVAWKLDR